MINNKFKLNKHNKIKIVNSNVLNEYFCNNKKIQEKNKNTKNIFINCKPLLKSSLKKISRTP